MAADDDLKNLRGDARFKSLIDELRAPTAANQLLDEWKNGHSDRRGYCGKACA
jgi:hypothetical protein